MVGYWESPPQPQTAKRGLLSIKLRLFQALWLVKNSVKLMVSQTLGGIISFNVSAFNVVPEYPVHPTVHKPGAGLVHSLEGSLLYPNHWSDRNHCSNGDSVGWIDSKSPIGRTTKLCKVSFLNRFATIASFFLSLIGLSASEKFLSLLNVLHRSNICLCHRNKPSTSLDIQQHSSYI